MRGDWGSGVWPDLNSLLLATAPHASRGWGSCASAHLPQGPHQTAVLCVSGGTCPCVVLARHPPTVPLERQVLWYNLFFRWGIWGTKAYGWGSCWPGFLLVVRGGHT